MQTAAPITTDVVLVGGGHTHAITLRKLGMVDLRGVQLTLITNLVDTPYSGMLPCHVSGLYGFDESHIDLRPLTRFARCRLLMDRAIGLDTHHQRVICAHHPPVAYDLLSIDTGSTPATVSVPGAQEYAIPAKPVPDLLRQWDQLLAQVRRQPQQPLTLVVVGGGVGGVELTLNMQERLLRLLQELGQSPDQLTLHLFHRGDHLAPGRNRWTQRRLETLFQQRGIQLYLNEAVTAIEAAADGQTYFVRSARRVVRCDRTFWVTSASAPAWPREAGLSTDDQGFITVRDTLQTCSHDNIFAVGDVATMVNHPRPKAGVFAVRQGKPLFKNLLRHLQGQSLKDFSPQRQFLNIIDIGYGRAIASRGPFMVESRLARWWKNRIDRKFMALFDEFPPMAEMTSLPVVQAAGAEAATAPPMPCAGCGSKVGRGALGAALQRVQAELPVSADWPHSRDILIGLEAPDDAAVVRVPAGQVMVHTVDEFRAIVDDPFVFAQIAANHSLSDLYAMAADPQSVLALVTVPYGMPPKQAEILYQVLCGLQKCLGQGQTPLVGGHTTEGPDLVLGLACNGLASPDRLLRKGGMAVGDRLILTQPLGTGILFAADMRWRAKGRWIEAAITHMLRSNQAAGQCLRDGGATACTDVTGFGLVGHLLEMVQAAGVGVALDLTDLPILDGVRAALQQNLLSSLHPQNSQAQVAIANAAQYQQQLEFPVLFDPQTSGGLLGSVPAYRADDCLQRLRAAGYPAVIIGEGVALEDPAQPIRIEAW